MAKKSASGWDLYFRKATVQFNLAELGCPDFWVKMRRLDTLPYGRTKRYIEGELSPQEALAETEELLKELIVEWNLPDFENPEQALPLPSEDPSVLEKLPSEFVAFFQKKLQETSQLASMVPQKSETSSGAP